MTYFSHIRAGLISTALLLTTALASPALAESLPEISPRQIASDVKVQYHPETGVKEYLAPSFDPFEEDRTMAGTASLRSVSGATTIDGQSVRGGALLDMTFYYSSPSNDPYDTRGYEDAVYLSGEYAPVTKRDTRILECNENVQDVVYYHEDYYRPSVSVNLFRPYRHYRGHHRFDRGYGYGRSYRGARGYTSNRGYRNGRGYRRGHDGAGRRGTRTRNNRGFADRATDRVREENGLPRRPRGERADGESRRDRADRVNPESRRDRNERTRNNRDPREGRSAPLREDRVATGRPTDIAPAANRAERRNSRVNRNRTNRSETRGQRTRRAENNGAPRIRENDRASTPRAERATRRVTPRAERAPRPTPRAAAPAPRPERAAPAPRPERAEQNRPARAERTVNRTSGTKSRNTPKRNYGGGKGGGKLKLMGFLPMASAWSRNIVRNVDVQCAREEILTVHIPQERLDAARFDGLTILVLDRAGEEVPVFLPPNYIEGFRQAVSGRVTPRVSYQEPGINAPAYQSPRPSTVESAPCPVGTTKQNDGTCLQGGTVTYGGYPTR